MGILGKLIDNFRSCETETRQCAGMRGTKIIIIGDLHSSAGPFERVVPGSKDNSVLHKDRRVYVTHFVDGRLKGVECSDIGAANRCNCVGVDVEIGGVTSEVRSVVFVACPFARDKVEKSAN